MWEFGKRYVISGCSEIEIVGHVIYRDWNKFSDCPSFVEMSKSFHGYELAVCFILIPSSTGPATTSSPRAAGHDHPRTCSWRWIRV